MMIFSDVLLFLFMKVDVDKVSGMVNSFHDLWSLPVQISIAFLLLYLQVDIAFFAGVVIIIGNTNMTHFLFCVCLIDAN
jgi:ATP-binding cassette, subfamily C (CFTR/MRP), member 10